MRPGLEKITEVCPVVGGQKTRGQGSLAQDRVGELDFWGLFRVEHWRAELLVLVVVRVVPTHEGELPVPRQLSLRFGLLVQYGSVELGLLSSVLKIEFLLLFELLQVEKTLGNLGSLDLPFLALDRSLVRDLLVYDGFVLPLVDGEGLEFGWAAVRRTNLLEFLLLCEQFSLKSLDL